MHGRLSWIESYIGRKNEMME